MCEQVGGLCRSGFHMVKEFVVSRHPSQTLSRGAEGGSHAHGSSAGEAWPAGQGSHTPAKRRETCFHTAPCQSAGSSATGARWASRLPPPAGHRAGSWRLSNGPDAARRALPVGPERVARGWPVCRLPWNLCRLAHRDATLDAGPVTKDRWPCPLHRGAAPR